MLLNLLNKPSKIFEFLRIYFVLHCFLCVYLKPPFQYTVRLISNSTLFYMVHIIYQCYIAFDLSAVLTVMYQCVQHGLLLFIVPRDGMI